MPDCTGRGVFILGAPISLRQALIDIATLQTVWTSKNSPDMQRRGVLVRDVLPVEILAYRGEICAALGEYGSDLGSNGRDATGRKSRVPWARIYSKRKSPLATAGWYVVYLFHADGSGVSLCLSHGSTTFDGSVYRDRSPTEVAKLMLWGRGVISQGFETDATVRAGVELGGKGLARSYERTTLFSKFYAVNAVPNDSALVEDLVRFARSLERLYSADDQGLSPLSSGVEVAAAIELANEIASPLKSSGRGQGRNLSPEARRAIELRAMALAKDWLKKEGFKSIKDVSQTHSCDFSARRESKTWVIEVKGTTGGASSVLLTRNEVSLHRKSHPLNALLVVHGIALSPDKMSASGGTLLPIAPWLLDELALSPTCYEYRLS